MISISCFLEAIKNRSYIIPQQQQKISKSANNTNNNIATIVPIKCNTSRYKVHIMWSIFDFRLIIRQYPSHILFVKSPESHYKSLKCCIKSTRATTSEIVNFLLSKVNYSLSPRAPSRVNRLTSTNFRKAFRLINYTKKRFLK